MADHRISSQRPSLHVVPNQTKSAQTTSKTTQTATTNTQLSDSGDIQANLRKLENGQKTVANKARMSDIFSVIARLNQKTNDPQANELIGAFKDSLVELYCAGDANAVTTGRFCAALYSLADEHKLFNS